MADPVPERVPGGEASLLALYELVPAAEQEDLAEEARAERRQRETSVLFVAPVHPDLGEPVLEEAPPEPEPDPGSDVAPMSDAAVIAMLEHRLGATPVGDEDDQADRTG